MIETYYRILKHDPEGKLVKDSGLIRSHSYVIQFLELIGALFDAPAFLAATDVDNAENIIYSSGRMDLVGRVDAGAGDDLSGIVVGTNAGVTAEDNLNYKLDTKIEHSAVGAADKLNYMAVTLIGARVVGANVDLDVTRTFLNESGGTISVKEIGLQTKLSTLYYHLILRDVVTQEDVEDGYTLTVVYTLRTTV